MDKLDKEAQSLLDMITNVDPTMADSLKALFEPKGDCAVSKSPNFSYIISSILKGMAPRAIQRALQDERAEKIPAVVIRDYVIKYIPHELTKPGVYIQYMASRFKHLDEGQMLDHVLRVQYARLSEMLESNTLRQDDLRREIDLFSKIARDSAATKAALATVKEKESKTVPANASAEPPTPISVDQVNVNNITIPSSGLDAREAAKVLKFIQGINRSSVTTISKDDKEKH